MVTEITVIDSTINDGRRTILAYEIQSRGSVKILEVVDEETENAVTLTNEGYRTANLLVVDNEINAAGA